MTADDQARAQLPILAGAEPGSWTTDSPVGVLVLHGFTGNCSSMRPLAEAFAEQGWNVELPLLPGHGTSIEDMLTTSWSEWSAAAEQAYHRLGARCTNKVIAGLSMGGSLTLWLAARHADVDGVICVNPATEPQTGEVVAMVQGMIDEGQDRMPGIGSDIADPAVAEIAYDGTPLAPLVSLMRALEELQPTYARTTHPLLLMTSPEDHVVAPEQSDHLAEAWAGPVERVSLDRSYHVATLDYDAPLIIERAVAFVEQVSVRRDRAEGVTS